MSSLPDLRFLLSINSENAWSDLLATLMIADQAITRSVLGINVDSPLQIRREVSKSRGRKASDRPDLVVQANGQVVAVVEVKLLAGLGIEQLERYYRYVAEEDRDDCRFVAVSLQRFRLDTAHAQDWQNLTWEELIAPFASSPVPWAATTATAWTSHIESQVPKVDAHTIWNQIDDIDLYLALRLRAAYMYDNVALPGGSSKAIREIGSGGLYVAIVDAPIPGSGYTVRWDATESLPTQEVGKLVDGSGLRGVDFRFFLVQQRVTSSKAFDWDHLALLWQEYLVQEDWIPWRPHPPRKTLQWEKDGVARLKALGAPAFLGAGYGEKQAKLSGEVEFGARFVLPPSTTLKEATEVLSRVAVIGSRMAQHATQPQGRL
ncbi:PD-(D/E)XK nuclease family protein [Streptomyces coelicoflavus]|uniref:PD-(D/E)XK nuclease family protein n=1 Tax=Streptomyces coelicoflavus TaxID=285562 RepID=UPI0013BF9976|nr:PD-(D/E)XK nuclease family protein [Streptomyces coelicoflavus]MCX5039891.1 PD-(D/E)XK nuclease family protein [Streptomyces coelicoflavus]MCX5039910.1 PD-(D/E)XK nuclease family protein [Streptomyces coelicoflavus]MCX5041446.1 PD-(D/E)XK nuclease family protein [Streptomyces coelicoflavus]NEB63020.1 PD-(D/E)XK nuclease family protein [Streptomyces diastaticus]